MDTDWARRELAAFLQLTELYRPPDPPGMTVFSSCLSNRGRKEQIVASAHVVEQILDHLLPRWRDEVPKDGVKNVNRWVQHREAVQRAVVAIDRQAEVDEKLGDNAPRLSATHLHRWVWDAARASWQAGFYGHAVIDALKRVNAETQRRGQRSDLSETDLFAQLFTVDEPKPGVPRLRLDGDPQSKSWQSLQRGVYRFAEGLYAAVRNPLSHDVAELEQDQALELLAAVSVLARWVDEAKLATA